MSVFRSSLDDSFKMHEYMALLILYDKWAGHSMFYLVRYTVLERNVYQYFMVAIHIVLSFVKNIL